MAARVDALRLPDATYDVQVGAGGDEVKMAVTVSEDGLNCQSDEVFGDELYVDARCSVIESSEIEIRVSDAFSSFSGPSSFTIRVAVGSDVLGEETFTPDYDLVELDCGETCLQASASMRILAPGGP